MNSGLVRTFFLQILLNLIEIYVVFDSEVNASTEDAIKVGNVLRFVTDEMSVTGICFWLRS